MVDSQDSTEPVTPIATAKCPSCGCILWDKKSRYSFLASSRTIAVTMLPVAWCPLCQAEYWRNTSSTVEVFNAGRNYGRDEAAPGFERVAIAYWCLGMAFGMSLAVAPYFGISPAGLFCLGLAYVAFMCAAVTFIHQRKHAAKIRAQVWK